MRPSTSSREKPKVICVRSLVPKEKKSATSAISPARRAARGVSIIVPMVTSSLPRLAVPALAPLDGLGAGSLLTSATASSTQPRASASSSRVTVRGIMISTMGCPPSATRWRAASISARTCMA